MYGILNICLQNCVIFGAFVGTYAIHIEHTFRHLPQAIMWELQFVAQLLGNLYSISYKLRYFHSKHIIAPYDPPG